MPTALHRQTLQNLLVNAKGPLSADEVRQELGHRSIGQATIYRLLKQGVEENQFLEVAFPEGPKRYEMAGQQHHHHFLCRVCDRAFDINGCPEQVSQLAPKDFQVDDHDILLLGRCPECAKIAR